MKKIAIWQIFLFEFVRASTLIESQCSALPQNSSCTLNCTSRIYEDYVGDCSPTVSVVEICNSSRCSLLENKNVTGSTIVQSTCSTFLDNNNDCQLNCSSRTYPYSDSCSGDVFVTEICDSSSCEVLYSRAVTVDIVECIVMPQENLLCDGGIYKAAYNWDLFFPCFYYKNSDEIFCQKKSYSNSINIIVPATQPALTTTTTSASNVPTWLPNLLENLGILAIGLFIGFYDDLFPAKEMITTTVATTTLAQENGLSDVIIAGGGFLTGILFLSLIEFLVAGQNNEILTTLAPTLSTILTTNSEEEDVQILDEFFVYDSCATSPQLFELYTGESFLSPGSPLSYNFVNCDGELTNLKSVASNQGIQFNLVLSEYDPVDSRIDFSNSNGDVFSFVIEISDENCANPRHSAFRKSLEMGFLERQQISNFKMKFALLTEDEISEEKLLNEASSSCYEALESMETGMIDCKIIQFSSPEPNTRSNSSSDCKSSSEVTLVARFLDNLQVEIKEEIIQNISLEIENRLNSKDDDGKIGQNEVLGLLTPKDNKGLFIAQMVVLSFCLCIGLAASAFQVQMYRAGASGNARHKTLGSLLYAIIFQFIWPIAGIVPIIFIWYEYETDDKLIYEPLPHISHFLLYFLVIKLVFFIGKMYLYFLKSKESQFLKDHPLILELFLDNDIVEFLLCNGWELLVIYFMIIRYMTPENDVSFSAIWFPVFEFLMAFIPGIFDIARAVKKYYKKRNSSKSSETSSLKKMSKSERCTKLMMTICSEAIQIVVLMLTFFIFMLSLIVSSCIPADNYIDARLRVMSENGTMLNKQSPLAQEKQDHDLNTGPICHLFPKQYFDTHMRLGDECLPKTSEWMTMEDGCELAQLMTKPIVVSHTCSNPVEYFVFVAIMIAMFLELFVLLLYVWKRYGQILKKEIHLRKSSYYGRKSSVFASRFYDLSNSQTKDQGILGHETTAPGKFSLKK